MNENSGDWQSWIWRMDESLAHLKSRVPVAPLTRAHMENWNETRQREWLTARWMFLHFAAIDPDMMVTTAEGKPMILNDARHISMSHTGGYVYVGIGTRALGIDIQVKRSDIGRIAMKFCSERDLSIWPQSMAQIDRHHHIWSAKEALFKAYGLGSINFKEHLIIKNVQQIGPESFVSEGLVTKAHPVQAYSIFLACYRGVYRALASGAF